MRKIIHVDMDAFYAAVEQRDCADYRGKPIIVGGLPNRRGVVATCSYEARAFGIHSAMPASTAHRLCPQAIFVRPRFDVYREASQAIFAIFRRHTELVEPLSLDEAFLDVTDSTQFHGSAFLLAQAIQHQIKKQTALSASAGVSYNKFLAKIASDIDKPNGLYVITPEQGSQFIEGLAIGKFHGIGKVTEAKLKSVGIHCGKDLKTWPLHELSKLLGKSARYFYGVARGIDDRPVQPRRQRQSLGKETTFAVDLEAKGQIEAALFEIAEQLIDMLKSKQLGGKTLTLKVRYGNFELITRSRTFTRLITQRQDIVENLPALLAKTEVGHRKVRLVGLSISKLAARIQQTGPRQLELFEDIAS